MIRINNYLKTKLVTFWIRLFLSFLILFYLVTLIDLNRFGQIFQEMRFEYAWPAFLFSFVTVLFSAIRWSFVLHCFSVTQTFIQSWRYYMISLFYGTLLPGAIGGDVVRIGLSLNKHHGSRSVVVTSVFFERICGFTVVVLIPAITILFVPSFLDSEQALSRIISGLALVTVTLFVLFFAFVKNIPKQWLACPAEASLFRSKASSILFQFRDIQQSCLLGIFLLTFAALFFDILGCFLLARSLHIELGFAFFLLVIPVVYVASNLPVSIGGLGVREGVLAFFMVKTGVLASDAVFLGLLIYLTRIVLALTGGVVQFYDKQKLSVDQ